MLWLNTLLAVNSLAPAASAVTCAIEDAGNNVYYFSCVSKSFAGSLGYFRREHPELEIVSIAPDDASGYGYTKGYIVVVKPAK